MPDDIRDAGAAAQPAGRAIWRSARRLARLGGRCDLVAGAEPRRAARSAGAGVRRAAALAPATDRDFENGRDDPMNRNDRGMARSDMTHMTICVLSGVSQIGELVIVAN